MQDTIFYSRPVPELVEMLREAIRDEIRIVAPGAQTPDDPLSIDQAAQLIGFSKSTVYGFVSKKEIPHYRKSGRLFFFRSELVEWIKGGNEAEVIEIVNCKHTQIKKAK